MTILEVAYSHSGSSSTWFLVELKFAGIVYFWGEGKTGLPGDKPLGEKERTNNKLDPNDSVDAGIWTRATLVGGECSHYCATLAAQFQECVKAHKISGMVRPFSFVANSIGGIFLKRRQSVFPLFIGFVGRVIVVFCRCLCTCLWSL